MAIAVDSEGGIRLETWRDGKVVRYRSIDIGTLFEVAMTRVFPVGDLCDGDTGHTIL